MKYLVNWTAGMDLFAQVLGAEPDDDFTDGKSDVYYDKVGDGAGALEKELRMFLKDAIDPSYDVSDLSPLIARLESGEAVDINQYFRG